jgi:serine/threonine-protein kinase
MLIASPPRDRILCSVAFAAIGAIFAGFRVQRAIGAGAMGDVYLAEDVRSGDRVALKVLRADLTEDERFRRRFEREGAIASKLDHPGVVRTVAAGEADGRLYLAMAYVDGSNLREILRSDSPLDIERALELVAQVADALDAAHRAGLVHRDVKPANVLVTGALGDERALVCDFGLARHVSSVTSLTSDRGFVGTIDYVPPEQIEGGTVDRRADIYSLGCVLFECLTGTKPFDRESELAIVFAHLNDPPPRATERVPELPEAFDEVFAKALAKSPDDRFYSCRDLVQAARAASHGKSLLRPRRRRLLVLPAAIVVLAAVATGSTIALESGSAHVKVSITQASIDGVRLGHKASWYEQRLGGAQVSTVAGPNYTALHFQTPEIAAYFPRADTQEGSGLPVVHTPYPAIIVTTWNRQFRTAAGIGPCSTLAAMRRAYGDRVAPDSHLRHGKTIWAWRLGRDIMFETQNHRTISAVVLFRVAHERWGGFVGQNETACE